MRPAMLFGNFQIITIYCTLPNALKKDTIIESKLNDTLCGFRPGRSNADNISLSRKFLRNLGSMP